MRTRRKNGGIRIQDDKYKQVHYQFIKVHRIEKKVHVTLIEGHINAYFGRPNKVHII